MNNDTEFPFMDDTAMFRNEPFHPITKEPIRKSSKLDCVMDTKFGTGMISCKEKKDHALPVTITIAFIAVIACLFLFSIQFEFKHLEEIPAMLFLVENPVIDAMIIISVLVIMIAIGIKKRS